MNDDFAKEVLAGLSSQPKHISSKWFYDETGDALFQQIMDLPEYYLTRAEFGILTEHATLLVSLLPHNTDLVELGAGDGQKTKLILHAASTRNWAYYPIDISLNALNKLQSILAIDFPNFPVFPIQDEYFSALQHPILRGNSTKLILFLGSNIGNLNATQTTAFLDGLFRAMQAGDMVLIGFDRVKAPEAILAAYNDASGVTAQFNLNLLTRMNRELDAQFDLTAWRHAPIYDEIAGEARSALVSLIDQNVLFGAFNQSIYFNKGEKIHTEISRKFNAQQIHEMAVGHGFEVVQTWHAPQESFTDVLWRKP